MSYSPILILHQRPQRMLCKQIVKTDYPFASLEDSRQQVESTMKELGLSAIPILSQDKWMGFLTKDMLERNHEESLSEIFSGIEPNFVQEDDHVFRALRLMANQSISLVAVLSKNNEYMGIITAVDLLPAIATLVGLDGAPSGSITIEMDRNNYSMGELARLVQANDAEILQLNTYLEASSGLFIITLKVSREDISDIVETLQRYDYRIRYYFGQESYENELKANYDALINYLNI